MHRLATPVFSAVTAAFLLFAPAPAHAVRMAPTFTVKTIEGKRIRLVELRNRPVIVDFWATWCGPCRASMPHLATLSTRYAKNDLVVVGISVDDHDDEVKAYVGKQGIPFNIAMANDEILDAYGPIRSIPTTVFINRKGQIVRQVSSALDPETLESYVKEIVAN